MTQQPDMSGLVAPKFTGAGKLLEQEIHEQWDTFETAELELTKAGFAPMEKPNCARPAVTPGKLSTLTGPQITTLYETVVAWHGYANNYLARIESIMQQLENEKKHLESVLYKGIVEAIEQAGEKKPTETAIKRDISLDPRIIELTRSHQQHSQQQKQISGWVDTFTEYRRQVSRQVEIRRQEIEGLVGGRAYSASPQLREKGQYG